MKKASLTNRVKKTIANKKIARQTIIALSLILLGSAPVWADQNPDIIALQQGWAETNYQLRDKAQLSAFEKLIDEATLLTEQYPQSAPAWIWSGIIKSTYAGARGGLGALKLAKAAKADLEQAMKLDPKAMNGSAYASLGVLYFNVPGWPIGFGDDEKAKKLLLKAIAINPEGIDSNYFYGDFLLHEKRYQDAKKYLLKAQNAPKRPDRPLADAGRQKEIALALSKVQIKLK
jgi:tetratricopeptide (TPR) repeat protein